MVIAFRDASSCLSVQILRAHRYSTRPSVSFQEASERRRRKRIDKADVVADRRLSNSSVVKHLDACTLQHIHRGNVHSGLDLEEAQYGGEDIILRPTSAASLFK